MMNRFAKLSVGLVVASLISVSTLSAQETLKVAAGQRGNWDTSVSEIGKRAGIFKKYGLDLDILYTQGSGETQRSASLARRSPARKICSGMCVRTRPSKTSKTLKGAPSPTQPMAHPRMAS